MSAVVSLLSAITTASVTTPTFYTTAQFVTDITNGEIAVADVQQKWIEWATQEVERQSGMHFRSTSFTDLINGNNLKTSFTRSFPLLQVSSVSIDGVLIDPSIYCVNLRTGSVTLTEGIYTEGVCNVEIKGTIGTVPIPPLIEKIATLIAAKTALRAKCGSLVDSESIGGFNQSRSLKKINDELDRAWRAWGKRFAIDFV